MISDSSRLSATHFFLKSAIGLGLMHTLLFLAVTATPGVFRFINPGIPIPLADPTLFSRWLMLGLIVIIYYIAAFRIKRFSLKISPLVILFAVIPLAYLLSSFFAVSFQEAIVKFGNELLVFLWLLIITVLFIDDPKNYIKTVARSILLPSSIFLFAFYYQLYEVMAFESFDHKHSYKLVSLMAHRNLAAQAAMLFLPLLIYNFFDARKFVKWLSFFFGILLLLAIYLSYSRTAWLALAILGVILVIVSLVHYRRNLKVVVITVIASLLVCSAFWFYMEKAERNDLKKQFDFLGNFKYGSNQERIYLWRNTIEDIKQKPVLGYGGGNWKLEAQKYNMREIRDRSELSQEVIFQRPHNDFLWIWHEAGIIGLLAVLLITLISLASLIRIKKNYGFGVFLLLLSFIIIWLITSLFSFPSERAFLRYLSALYFAAFIVLSDYGSVKAFNRFYLAIPLVLLIGIVYMSTLRFNGASHIFKMMGERAEGNYLGQIQEGNQAKNRFLSADDTATPISWYIGEGWYLKGQWKLAHNYFTEAYAVNPYHSFVLNNLGTTTALSGDTATAISLYRKAVEYSPDFDQCRMNLVSLVKDDINEVVYQLSQMDTLSSISSYYQVKQYYLHLFTMEIRDSLGEDDLVPVLNRILMDPVWLNKIFLKSIAEERTFKDQLLLDARFILDTEAIDGR